MKTNVIHMFKKKPASITQKMIDAGYIPDADTIHRNIVPVTLRNEITGSYDTAEMFQVTRAKGKHKREAVGMFTDIELAILFDKALKFHEQQRNRK